MHKRLIAMLDHFGCNLNISRFAKSVGVRSQNISSIYNNGTIPNLKLIVKIASKFPRRINYHWLLTGEGVMLPNLTILDNEEVLNTHNVNEFVLKYKQEMTEKYNACLLQLQEKDQKIIGLQEERDKANTKVIKLLEEQKGE